MKKLSVISGAAIILGMLVFGFLYKPQTSSAQVIQAGPKNHSRKIDKRNGRWKIDSTRAKKRDYVTFHADGSDMYFQFMDKKLFGHYKYQCLNGDSLRLPIKNTAVPGKEYRYAVFVLKEKVYAEGDSPPVIIVER